jgi:signal transduction histidine kinase
VAIRACVEYLEEYVSRSRGPDAGRRAVEELVQRLNQRIPDRAFHVTSKFLRTPWNGYSNEFSAFVSQFCSDISGDPKFQFNFSREKAISPIIQTLGRPFSVPIIYKMSAYFSQRYSKDSFYTEAVSISERSAILRMVLKERALRHFGPPYLKACARLWCEGNKGYFSGVPERFHDLPPAEVRDVHCIAEGDECCEWEVTWPAKESKVWPVVTSLARRLLAPEIDRREKIIDEQLRSLDSWHQELQAAYIQQQHLTAELQRRVDQLTTLHQTGLMFTSILDREKLIEIVLETIIHKLNYDRVMLSFFDSSQKVIHDARLMGVSEDIRSFARSIEIPVTPNTLEGEVLLKGEPILIGDIQQVSHRLHPLNRQLLEMAKAKSLISVPVKVKNEVLGALTVDRTQEHSLTADDLNLLGTLASQVAIGLDNTSAYRKIEELMVGLEAKVRERTEDLERLNRELETANKQLKEADRLKSLFLSHVSHELRTPLTAVKGFVENILHRLSGPLTAKQEKDLVRVRVNADRLIRMIANLLDQSRIEFGKIDLSSEAIELHACAADLLEQLRPLSREKKQHLDLRCLDPNLVVWADGDKLIQILTNLVENAIKYTPEGGHVAIELSRAGPAEAKVSVIDDGVGIPQEALTKLFDPFYRVRQTTTGAAPKGLGLGLSIARYLAESRGKIVGYQRAREGLQI